LVVLIACYNLGWKITLWKAAPYPRCAVFVQDTGRLRETLLKSVYLQMAVDAVGSTVTHIVRHRTGLNVQLSPQVARFLIRPVETGQIAQIRHPLEQTSWFREISDRGWSVL
jgi:hypothetical protein